MSRATLPAIESLESAIAQADHTIKRCLLASSLSAGPPAAAAALKLKFTSPVAQTFARLALKQTITWSQLDRALQDYFAEFCDGLVSASASASAALTSVNVITDEFGLSLVCRVMKRFVEYEVVEEESECVEWCRRLEWAVLR